MFFLQFFVVILTQMDPDPGIRIFLRIRIKEANILRIQRIRILSIAQKSFKLPEKYASFNNAKKIYKLCLRLLTLFVYIKNQKTLE